MATWRVGFTVALCSLLLTLSACGGGSPVNSGAQDGFEGDLTIELERLAAQQNSRIIPIRVIFPATRATQDIPVWIRLGYKLSLNLSERINNMSPASGTPNFNDSRQIFMIPPEGTDFLLFWDAARDLGDSANENTVVLRAGVLRTDADDPREAVCDFQPVVQVVLDGGIACPSAPPRLDDATLETLTPGVIYESRVEADGGELPLAFDLWDPETMDSTETDEIAPGLFLNENTGAVSGTLTETRTSPIEFFVRISDNCGGETPNTGERANTQATGDRVFTRFDLARVIIPVATGECPEPPPAITSGSQTQSITFNTPVDLGLEANGGTGLLTWAEDDSNLPAELVISPEGRITGRVLSYSVSPTPVRVTDSCVPARFDIQDIRFVIACQDQPPAIDFPQPVPQGMVGENYDYTFNVNFPGGFGSVSLDDGNLPLGVSSEISVDQSGLNASVHLSGVILPEASGVRQGQGGTGVGDFVESVWRAADACPDDSLSTFGFLVINVLPPGACAPLNITTPASLPSGTVGTPYSVQLQANGGVPPLTWFEEIQKGGSGLPQGLTLNTSTGVISGTPQVNGTDFVTISVFDSCSNPSVQSSSRDFDITINPIPCAAGPSLSRPLVLPDTVNNVEYSFQVMATGGVPPLTFMIQANPDSLPDGMTMSTSGLITGSADEKPGTFTFDIVVADSCPGGSQFDTETVTLNVVDPCSAVGIATKTLGDAENGTLYSEQLDGFGQGPVTWSLSAGALPTGLTLDASGLISGIPGDKPGTYNITVMLADSCPLGTQTATANLSIQLNDPVMCAPLDIRTTAIDPAVNFTDYSFQMEATGGEGTLSWALDVDSNPLPFGLRLMADGVLSGVPDDKDGIYSVTIDVMDECLLGSQLATASFDIELSSLSCTPLFITTKSIDDIIIGQKYFFELTATGGEGRLTWALDKSSDPLPDGITLDPMTGILSGTVIDGSVPFEPTLVFLVSDECVIGPQSDSDSFLISVRCTALGPPQGTPPPAENGMDYSYQLTLDNPGVPPISWFIDSKFGDGLPAGMNIDSMTGEIMGAPDSRDGDFLFRVFVTDSCDIQQAIAGDFTLTVVNCLPLGPIDNQPDPATNGESFSYIPTLASPGRPPYSWFINGKVNPPEGLVFDFDTGSFTGIPMAVPGRYVIPLGVSDDCKQFTEVDLIFDIAQDPTCDNLRILNGPFPDATLFIPYRVDLDASGGSGNYVWQLAPESGPLPDGLMIDFDGEEWNIQGNPFNAAQEDVEFPFTLQVIDFESCVTGPILAELDFSITVRQGI